MTIRIFREKVSKIMKTFKIGAILATLLCIVFLAGCSSNTSNSGTQSSDTSNSTAEKVASVDTKTVYVTPSWLNSAMNGDQKGYEKLTILEVVYDDSANRGTYDDGHIKGAILAADVDVEDADGTQERPYNLLPASEMEKNILKRGITKDTKVVLYGADISGVARVAYAYLWAGVEDVKILNGGIDAWKSAGYETEKTSNSAKSASSFGTTIPAHPEYWTSMTEAKNKLATDSNFKLVSIRSEAEWLGTSSGYSYIQRAGEPEGAVWGKGAKTASDVADFTNDDGTVKNLSGLQEVWKDCNFTLQNQLAFYCGTGWRACVPFLVLYENGYANISLYDGGWYEWQMYSDNPVQVGDPTSESCQHTTVSALPTDKAA